jgi:hypothetical protein
VATIARLQTKSISNHGKSKKLSELFYLEMVASTVGQTQEACCSGTLSQ